MRLLQSLITPIELSRNFSKRIALSFLFCFTSMWYANGQDSVRRQKHWAFPDHAIIQFAGGIGYVSVGAGYTARKEKLKLVLLYGYVPESIGGLPIHAATAQLKWMPLKPFRFKNFELQSLVTGLLVNYTFGKQYFAFSPEYYPFNYYGHPTSIHAGILAGSEIYTLPKKNKKIKQWGLYYELVSYDVELVSYFGNTQTLSFKDVLSLGFGIRMRI